MYKVIKKKISPNELRHARKIIQMVNSTRELKERNETQKGNSNKNITL